MEADVIAVPISQSSIALSIPPRENAITASASTSIASTNEHLLLQIILIRDSSLQATGSRTVLSYVKSAAAVALFRWR